MIPLIAYLFERSSEASPSTIDVTCTKSGNRAPPPLPRLSSSIQRLPLRYKLSRRTPRPNPSCANSPFPAAAVSLSPHTRQRHGRTGHKLPVISDHPLLVRCAGTHSPPSSAFSSQDPDPGGSRRCAPSTSSPTPTAARLPFLQQESVAFIVTEPNPRANHPPQGMARSALYVVALVVAAIALQAPTQASFTYTEEDLASDDSMWALYERWAAHHEVVREHGEKARRFPIFKNNARRNHDKYGNKGKSAINIFGDMTYEEVITVATGLRESDQDEQCSDNFVSQCTLNSQ
ncbi:uncharacterized protein LOC101761201 [Setaria italica]|nr:uncharacterized protein LOC101761201 [Setaria italica]